MKKNKKDQQNKYLSILLVVGVLVTILLVVLNMNNKQDNKDKPSDIPSSNNQENEQKVTGVILEVNDKNGKGTFIIEGGGKIIFSYNEKTVFQLIDEPTTSKDLEVGNLAIVFYSNGLRESYPMQGDADKVYILKD